MKREGKGREGKGREGKGRGGEGREGKGNDRGANHPYSHRAAELTWPSQSHIKGASGSHHTTHV